MCNVLLNACAVVSANDYNRRMLVRCEFVSHQSIPFNFMCKTNYPYCSVRVDCRNRFKRFTNAELLVSQPELN